MTILKILQGAEQIGGNFVLIEGCKSRLILDFGVPLTDIDGTPTDIKLQANNISCPIEISKEKETIAFLSHAHPDHFGLFSKLDKSITIYTTRITKDLIKECSVILYNNMFDELNLKEITNPIETKDFIVEYFDVNHSVAGACGFKIKDKNSAKIILYSGDLRCHGRGVNNGAGSWITKCKNPDYLILEGTTLSRKNQKVKTEQDVQDEMTEIFSENKMSIVCCSPLNKDRFLSVYNAAKAKNKTLVIDPYTALILEKYKDSDSPQYNSENIKVYCANHPQSNKVFENRKNMRFGRNKILLEQILKEPQKYIIKHNSAITQYILEKISIDDINVIYSYWEGYLDNNDKTWGKYRDKLKLIHTSGHIYEQDLIQLVEKLNPKNIIPIHTLANDKFQELFGKKVLRLSNNSHIKF